MRTEQFACRLFVNFKPNRHMPAPVRKNPGNNSPAPVWVFCRAAHSSNAAAQSTGRSMDMVWAVIWEKGRNRFLGTGRDMAKTQ